jgi:hypothetical protein
MDVRWLQYNGKRDVMEPTWAACHHFTSMDNAAVFQTAQQVIDFFDPATGAMEEVQEGGAVGIPEEDLDAMRDAVLWHGWRCDFPGRKVTR